jgi:Ser/Thr protein kinase RdoA (MazF antagonist)
VQFSSARPQGSRYLDYSTNRATLAARASGSDRSPTDVVDRDASDLARLAASLDALALYYCEPDVEEADFGDGTSEALVREVTAMPSHSFKVSGVFDPEAIAAMSEAFEAACALQDASQPEVVREIIAKRIIAAATTGERDPLRLQAAAFAEGQIS